MKDCGYCGAKNDDSALQCMGCGNPFRVKSPDKGSAPALPSPLASEVATGAGVLLIIMALFLAVGRMVVDAGIVVLPPQPYPGYSSFFTTSTPAPFIALVVIYPIFVLCRARFGIFRAARLTILVLVLAGTLLLLSRVVPVVVLIWCVPAVLMSMAIPSSFGFYFGAALQVAFGTLLLVRSRPRSREASAAQVNQSTV
jgi:hypothetical protein